MRHNLLQQHTGSFLILQSQRPGATVDYRRLVTDSAYRHDLLDPLTVLLVRFQPVKHDGKLGVGGGRIRNDPFRPEGAFDRRPIDAIVREIEEEAGLAGLTPAEIDGSKDKAVELKAGTRTLTFTGQSYLLHFVLPNFFFHVTTAYAILRNAGVGLGKMDYLGGA